MWVTAVVQIIPLGVWCRPPNIVSKTSMVRLNTKDQDAIGVTDFDFLKVLGRGSFGKVMLAELKGDLIQDLAIPNSRLFKILIGYFSRC